MKARTPKEEEFLRRVKNHPELIERFDRLMSLVENSKGDIIKADDAEMRVIEEVRKMGKEVLTAWTDRSVKNIEAEHDAMEDCSRVGKKNSGGIAATGGLK